MTRRAKYIAVVALVPPETRVTLARQLAPLNVRLTCNASLAGFVRSLRGRQIFEVAIVPAVLPNTSWWPLWGEISQLMPMPEVLVYAESATFQLWSGVLEAGGYDVVVEPFSDQEIQRTVLRAADSFRKRRHEIR